MSTVAELIDRVYLEWLYRPDDQPVRTTLRLDLDASAPTAHIYTSYMTVEEQNLLTVGSLVEIGQELILVTNVDLPNRQVTGVRGYQGSTAAAHSPGDIVYLNPHFPRMAVFNALADAVVDLHPDLWHTYTQWYTNSATFVEVPASVTGVLRARSRYGDSWLDIGAIFLKEFPDSRTDVAVQLPGVARGERVLLTLRQKFTRPTAETTEVDEIEPDWEQLVVLGTVVNLAAATDMDAASSDYVTETFEAANYPVGSGERISRAVLRLYEYKLSKAKRELAERYATPTVINSVTYGGF